MKNSSSILVEQNSSKSEIQNNISTMINYYIDELYNDHEYQQASRLLYSREPFNFSIRAIVEARLENIEQRTQQIIKFINESSTSLLSST